VARWSQGDAETIKETASHVLRTAHILAEAITESEEETEVA